MRSQRLLRFAPIPAPERPGHASQVRLGYDPASVSLSVDSTSGALMAALTFMVGAKLTNVGVPLLLKNLVDSMSYKPSDPAAVLVVPVALLFAYGALRLSTTLLTELRELVFC
jgi:hypothetical protein